MKQLMQFVMLTGTLFFMAGCSLNGDEEAVAEILSTTPTGGTESVAKTIALKVEFSEPMDTISCQSRYRLYQGELTTFPEGTMMGMAGMQHGEPGQFRWNEDHTEMTFQPDSMLMDSTIYSICLGEGMQAHNHGRGMGTGMSGMSSMKDYSNNTDGGMIIHFQTGNE